jgi:hypothetical protein
LDVTFQPLRQADADDAHDTDRATSLAIVDTDQREVGSVFLGGVARPKGHTAQAAGHGEGGRGATEEAPRRREMFGVNYREAMTACAEALRQLAAEAGQVQAKADRAFSQLVERYLRFRAGGGERGGTLEVTGLLDLDEGLHVHLTEEKAGSLSSDAMSGTVLDHVRAKPLAGFDDWTVRIVLGGQAAPVVLTEGPRGRGSRTEEISDVIADEIAAAGGASAMWALLDDGTLGSHFGRSS